MSRKIKKPEVRSSSFLNANNLNLAHGKSMQPKSKSYLAKLRDKQEQLAKENAFMFNNLYRGEELTEKPSVYSEKSFLKSEISFEQKPSVLKTEDEEILNIIRIDRPKAEMRSSPKHVSVKFPSPPKNQILAEKCEEVETELKNQRTKYRKLEAQYNELISKNTHIEMFYNDILENLKAELENTSNHKNLDSTLSLLGTEIFSIKNKLKQLESKSFLIEEKLKLNK